MGGLTWCGLCCCIDYMCIYMLCNMHITMVVQVRVGDVYACNNWSGRIQGIFLSQDCTYDALTPTPGPGEGLGLYRPVSGGSAGMCVHLVVTKVGGGWILWCVCA